MGSYVQGEDQVPVYESGAEVLQKLQEKWKSPAPYPAMYSSVFGGIILDPAMMVVPIDDHMVHRGHGVFDTAMILDGCLYELDPHLDRFLRSAATARIGTPFPRDTLRSILIQMTAASGCRKGSIRYWLSSGPGDFLLSSKGCPGPAFYGVVIPAEYEQCREGVRAVTTSVPMKPPLFATMKNVNYLPNVLSIMDAEDRGAFASVWVDEEGYVAEGPMVNVAFVTPERELVLPAFDKILSGCTARRMLALAPKLVDAGLLTAVTRRARAEARTPPTPAAMATTATSPLFSLSSLSTSLPSPTRLPTPLSLRALSPRARLSASLQFASPLGGFGSWATTSTSSAGRWRKRGLEVVCEATTGRRPDSVKKRERQNDRHRIRNHARKAEMRTRMKKVFRALEKLRKKADAQPEDIIEIEKMISEAYKAIDKTVKVGAMHRNTGNHRKSRLARRKKAIEILRGWYVPNAEPAAAV